MKEISVIMPVYLGNYPGCAKDRDYKFIRAVKSFIQQDLESKELVICSDGCDKSKEIYNRLFSWNKDIQFIKIEKQQMFSGIVRQTAIDNACGEIICFLDSDDTFGKRHLTSIVNGIDDYDWCYWDDYVFYDNKQKFRSVELKESFCSTGSFAYKKNLNVSWAGCNGYNQDWQFISKLLGVNKNYHKINSCSYIYHHIPNVVDN